MLDLRFWLFYDELEKDELTEFLCTPAPTPYLFLPLRLFLSWLAGANE